MRFWIFAAMTIMKILRSVPRRTKLIFISQEEYEGSVKAAKRGVEEGVEKYGAMSNEESTRVAIYNVTLLAAITPSILYLIVGLMTVSTTPFYILAGLYTLDLIYSTVVLYRVEEEEMIKIKWYERVMDVIAVIFYTYNFVEIVFMILGV